MVVCHMAVSPAPSGGKALLCSKSLLCFRIAKGITRAVSNQAAARTSKAGRFQGTTYLANAQHASPIADGTHRKTVGTIGLNDACLLP